MRITRPLALAAAIIVAGATLLHSTPFAYTQYMRTLDEPTRDFPATVRAATTTATAAAFAQSGTATAYIGTALAGTATARAITATATATITPTIVATITPTTTATLPPAFGTVDPCSCLRPTPDITECASIIATLYAGYGQAFASQTALARGTDTATPTASATATDTPTATPTPEPPTAAPTATRTATRTVEPTPTLRPRWRVYAPFAYTYRRPRR